MRGAGANQRHDRRGPVAHVPSAYSSMYSRHLLAAPQQAAEPLSDGCAALVHRVIQHRAVDSHITHVLQTSCAFYTGAAAGGGAAERWVRGAGGAGHQHGPRGPSHSLHPLNITSALQEPQEPAEPLSDGCAALVVLGDGSVWEDFEAALSTGRLASQLTRLQSALHLPVRSMY